MLEVSSDDGRVLRKFERQQISPKEIDNPYMGLVNSQLRAHGQRQRALGGARPAHSPACSRRAPRRIDAMSGAIPQLRESVPGTCDHARTLTLASAGVLPYADVTR